MQDIRFIKSKKNILLIAILCVVAGCAGNVQSPQKDTPPVPSRFKNADEQSVHDLPRKWWLVYQDETLNALIEACLRDQPYTQIGVLRQVAARAKAQGISADKLPYVSGNAGISNLRTSATTPLGDVLSGGTIHGNKFMMGFDAAWQFDVWKRVAHAVEAADAGVGMAEAFAGRIEMVLSTEVAVAYWQFREAESELDLLTSIRDRRVEEEQLLSARFQAGLANGQASTKAKIEIATAEIDIEEAKKKRSFAEHELATLVVKPLVEFSMGITHDYAFPPLPEISLGLPAGILARRADLVESTFSLRMLLAEKKVAETALYPSIGLTGNLGLASKELKDLLKGDSKQFTLGPLGLSLPIFDGGKIRANIAAADAQYQEALNLHQSHLLIALREVDDALTEVRAYKEQIEQQIKITDNAREITAQVKARYDNGLISFIGVSKAQHKALAAERKLVQLRTEGLFASIRLVTALGGGWSSELQKKI